MFKVEDNFLIWDDSRYLIPEELHSMKVARVFGTATKGLRRQNAIFLRIRSGRSSEVALINRNVSGHLIGEHVPERGELVYIREQLEPNGKSFWLISKDIIENDVNWINILYRDGTLLRMCPFSNQYWISK